MSPKLYSMTALDKCMWMFACFLVWTDHLPLKWAHSNITHPWYFNSAENKSKRLQPDCNTGMKDTEDDSNWSMKGNFRFLSNYTMTDEASCSQMIDICVKRPPELRQWCSRTLLHLQARLVMHRTWVRFKFWSEDLVTTSYNVYHSEQLRQPMYT